MYSYLSNKRSLTIIFLGKIFQALRSYQRPFVYLFLKKIIEKLGENRKNWLFSKASLYSFTKIPGPLSSRPLVYHLLGFDIFSRPYGYFQPYVY